MQGTESSAGRVTSHCASTGSGVISAATYRQGTGCSRVYSASQATSMIILPRTEVWDSGRLSRTDNPRNTYVIICFQEEVKIICFYKPNEL